MLPYISSLAPADWSTTTRPPSAADPKGRSLEKTFATPPESLTVPAKSFVELIDSAPEPVTVSVLSAAPPRLPLSPRRCLASLERFHVWSAATVTGRSRLPNRHEPDTAFGANSMPPAPMEIGDPESVKSLPGRSKRSPRTVAGAGTCADVPPVANLRIVIPPAKSGKVSPSQFSAVANELLAPPPFHTASTTPASAVAAADQATASESSSRATVSPAVNAAETSLAKYEPETRS